MTIILVGFLAELSSALGRVAHMYHDLQTTTTAVHAQIRSAVSMVLELLTAFVIISLIVSLPL